MHKSVQALVAIACIVIIGVGGWWMKIQADEAKAKAEMRETARWLRELETNSLRMKAQAEMDRRIETCRQALAAYDENGATFLFVQRASAKGELTGDTMMAEVRACRDLLAG